MRLPLAAVLMCSAAALAAGPESREPLVIKKHFSAADRAAGRYQYVPFDVPSGVNRIRITYAYTREGGNTIDLGLFEPGSLTLGTAAFRGWSGGERETIEIGEQWSSPGYRTGVIRPGQWNVALGMYRVGQAGVDVTVTVQFNPAESLQPAGPAPAVASDPAGAPPPPSSGTAGSRWWHGDLHVHTEHSDGKHSVSEVARLAAASGLDFIVLTDHNNTTHRRDLDAIRTPLVLSGEEITTPGGHANVWGLGPDDWFDFRLLPRDPRLAGLVDAAHARGVLFSINHPFISCDQCSWAHQVPASLDAIEIWNGPLGPQQEAVAMWERLLQSGRHVTAVASSDWHRGPEAPIGAGSVRVLADALDQGKLLEAIRAGRVIMMRDAAAPAPRVVARASGKEAGVGDTLEVKRGSTVTIELTVERFASPGLAGCPAACRADLITDTGRGISEPLSGGTAAFNLEPAADGFFRITISAGTTVVAMTNPIWLRVK